MKKGIMFLIAGFIMIAGTIYATGGINKPAPDKTVVEIPDKDPKAKSADDSKDKKCCSDKKADAKNDKGCCKSGSDSKSCSDSKKDDEKPGCSSKADGASSGKPETKSASSTASAQATPAASGNNCSRTKCQ